MAKVCIGIYLDSSGDRLSATLESLHLNTSQPVEIVLLPDAPSAGLQTILARHPELPVLATDEPRGPATCFNKMIAACDADITIFLEGGAVVGRLWLEYLLSALAADPRNGLAGPSTNRSWNEQGAFPGSGGSLTQVMAKSEVVIQRFGASWRTLEPLYSLGDFCYAVRREVVEAVGGADEAYGCGPCWEMDYNIRAARAGFQGVWACGAYVYRPPFSPRRRAHEAKLFDANKRLYQDRFCALRRTSPQAEYQTHCRGADCEHFALPGLIQIRLPLPDTPKTRPANRPAPAVRPPEKTGPAEPRSGLPLVSCIMPTGNRPEFALQAVDYFQRQDYPARELVILDDSQEAWQHRLPDDERIRLIRVPRGQSIGAKRNLACKAARGEIIAHWDDDDWYAPNRLSTQVAPLRSGVAEITGLTGTLFFELGEWRFWTCTRQLHRRLFVEDVHGGTLVFWKRLWEDLARYPDRSLAEDAAFLQQAVRRGARLHRLPNDGLHVYLRHERNSWSFACGRYLDPAGWSQVAEPPFPQGDRAFYARQAAAHRAGGQPLTPPSSHPLPLVSCIMPTADRRHFVPDAIRYFLRQDYPAKELVIVDDGRVSIADLIPDTPAIRYFRGEMRKSVGAKRNFACQQARGEIIVHWDDDDWNAPWRLSCQVDQLLQTGAEICGLNHVYYFSPETRQSWQYVFPPNAQPWVAGNSLAYTRAFWGQNPFQDLNIGEDTRFVWSKRPKQISVLPDPSFLVAMIHSGNVSPKRPVGSRWRPQPVETIWGLLGEDAPRYQGPASR